MGTDLCKSLRVRPHGSCGKPGEEALGARGAAVLSPGSSRLTPKAARPRCWGMALECPVDPCPAVPTAGRGLLGTGRAKPQPFGQAWAAPGSWHSQLWVGRTGSLGTGKSPHPLSHQGTLPLSQGLWWHLGAEWREGSRAGGLRIPNSRVWSRRGWDWAFLGLRTGWGGLDPSIQGIPRRVLNSLRVPGLRSSSH